MFETEPADLEQEPQPVTTDDTPSTQEGQQAESEPQAPAEN